MKRKHAGFTLMEVLIALVILAIALTALLKASAQTIAHTEQLKEKTIRHWVAMQGIAMVQLGLLPTLSAQETTQMTTMLGKRWYWRAQSLPTEIPNVQKISIKMSLQEAGPFTEALTGFRYLR